MPFRTTDPEAISSVPGTGAGVGKEVGTEVGKGEGFVVFTLVGRKEGALEGTPEL